MADSGNTVNNGPVVRAPSQSPQTSSANGKALQGGAGDTTRLAVKSSGDALAVVTVDGVTIGGDGASHPLFTIGGGGTLSVSDNTTTVNDVTAIQLETGLQVEDLGGGVAGIKIAPGTLPQTGLYTANGAETGAGFQVVLAALNPPIVMASGNYTVMIECSAVDSIVGTAALNTTNVDFTCIPTAQLTAGDIFFITVFPFTPI